MSCRYITAANASAPKAAAAAISFLTPAFSVCCSGGALSEAETLPLAVADVLVIIVSLADAPPAAAVSVDATAVLALSVETGATLSVALVAGATLPLTVDNDRFGSKIIEGSGAAVTNISAIKLVVPANAGSGVAAPCTPDVNGTEPELSPVEKPGVPGWGFCSSGLSTASMM